MPSHNIQKLSVCNMLCIPAHHQEMACCFLSLSDSCLFISSIFLILRGVQSLLGPKIFHSGNPSRIPRSCSVFCSTKLYFPSSLYSLKGSFRDTGGFVITRDIRKRFFDAECNIKGCKRYTSLIWPVASMKLSSSSFSWFQARSIQNSRPSYSACSGSLTDFIHGVMPSGCSYCFSLSLAL